MALPELRLSSRELPLPPGEGVERVYNPGDPDPVPRQTPKTPGQPAFRLPGSLHLLQEGMSTNTSSSWPGAHSSRPLLPGARVTHGLSTGLMDTLCDSLKPRYSSCKSAAT